ncbi:MAG: molybdopterin-synthase adenylyltransferase MoeB [Calditrichaeota bacterium]|nr:MAG: molybdopterin-synthase adenylyltransferase MoeB [Calditrichota bacterium]
MNLTKNEIERYSRQLVLPEFGIAGQEKLKAAKVLCVGTGGLGSSLLLYLAASGVGQLGIVDFDVVDASNLQRQIIHGTSSIGKSKVESAKDAIFEINPLVKTDIYDAPFTTGTALDLVKNYDVIVDCTDNFPTRYLINDACVLADKPFVYGSIFRFEGQASVFNYQDGPNYRDLYPTPPSPWLVPNCVVGGVLGILPGTIGLIQATETVKILIGKGETLSGRLLLYDAMNMRFRELKLKKNPAREPITELINYTEFCGTQSPGDTAVEIDPALEITATELAEKLKTEDITLIDIREPLEWEICHLPGSTLIPLSQLAEKTKEIDKAKKIVACCRSGVRSVEALHILHKAGFTDAVHLRGGVHAWCDEVDQTMPKY